VGTGPHWIEVTCIRCDGSKRVGNKACPLCNGTGKIKVPPLDDKD
jgi:hypothetical protein